jgi:hypothetical protein
MNHDLTLLESFLIDNPEFERLETLLDQFNIFEVLGAVRQEVRHSEFLAFLLNPQGSHGLGDDFVRRFLQSALAGVDTSGLAVTALDLALWALDDLEVRREWQNIDLLLLSENNRLAVIIENKVGSKEHSNQLQRYFQITQQHFLDWHILGLFLTPEGEEPSDERYLSFSYGQVCDLLETLAATREASLGPDVHTLIEHYTRMLRRHIVSGSEIEELCRKIYRKHKQALDLIYEYIPDLQANLQEYLMELITEVPELMLDQSSKSSIRFYPTDWAVPALQQGEGWTRSGQILLFEFSNRENRLLLNLYIGPGPLEIRQKLHALAVEKQQFFTSTKTLNRQWNKIFGHSFLQSRDYEDASLDDLAEKIKSTWDQFIIGDLEKIKSILESQEWIWQNEVTSG